MRITVLLYCQLLLTTAVLPLAMAEEPALATDRLDATIVVEAVLRQQSDVPALETIQTYQEALGWYEWEVTKVVSGTLPDKHIHVSHWLVRRNIIQPITKTPVAAAGTPATGRGAPKAVTLHLRPYQDVAPVLATVETSNQLEGRKPQFHDVQQRLELPNATGRWNYVVDIADKMPLLFRLKDQLKMVILGDCQAWFTNRPEFYMAPENLVTPVALNLCQQRSGLPLQKTIIDTYLVHLPKLEYVVLTWNPRFVNSTWREHGRKNGEFRGSPAFKADAAKGDQVFAEEPGGRVTINDIMGDVNLRAIWSQQPWGWTGHGSATEKQIRDAINETNGIIKAKPSYNFDNGRWQLVEQMAETLKAKGVKLMIFTTPIHPLTASANIKDKSRIPADGYQDQMNRLRDLEKRFAGTVYFYDLNNAGDNGLENSDFVNVDHVSRDGAEKVSRRVEEWRLRVTGK